MAVVTPPAELEGLISTEVGDALAALAAAVPANRAIVEIGSYKGKSTAFLAAGALAGKGARVYAVDPWNSPGNAGGRFGFDRAETFAAFVQQLRLAGVLEQVTPIQGFSVEVARKWRLTVGLLYIDGSHTEKDVDADWSAWLPHLASDAVVAFDDYDTPRNPGVKRVIDRLRRGEFGEWDFGPHPLAIVRLGCR